ncbi:MAG: iron-sulfur cluster assembly scaffold protein [Candidatus Geothermincolia bacterium]
MDDEFLSFVEAMRQEATRGFSATVIEHAMNPKNVGRSEDEDGFAIFKGPCGDTMAISIKLRDGSIEDVRFTTDGCGTSLAAGSMTTELARGMSPEEALKLGQEEVLGALDGLPRESEHCALLAATTLHMAIRNAQGEPAI